MILSLLLAGLIIIHVFFPTKFSILSTKSIYYNSCLDSEHLAKHEVGIQQLIIEWMHDPIN